jgi:hypothetical protein
VVYAGIGPGRAFAATDGVGWGVDYELDAVVAAMDAALAAPRDDADRARRAAWAASTLSLAAVARRAAEVVASALERPIR